MLFYEGVRPRLEDAYPMILMTLSFVIAVHFAQEDEVLPNYCNVGKKQNTKKRITPFYMVHQDHGRRCDKCSRARDVLKSAETVLEVHIEIQAVHNHKDYKQQRKEYLNEFRMNACALRNSGGGIILVHFTNRHENDKIAFLGWFDEMVDTNLQNLIEDDTLFIDNFDRRWLFPDNNETLVVTIKKANKVSTANYATKISLDDRLIDPHGRNIVHIMRQRKSDDSSDHDAVKIDWKAEYIPLYESRSVQFKKFCGPSKNAVEVVDKLWTELKLAENITALSKNYAGGSYFCGIAEASGNSFTKFKYETKRSEVLGLSLPETVKKNLKECLDRKITNSMVGVKMVSNKPEIDNNLENLVSVKVHETTAGKCVIEIRVRFYNGIIFFDTEGPFSYIYNKTDQIIERVPLDVWLKKMMS